MSGHSKWSQIKHKKAHTDSQKSQVFGRLAREILIAATRGHDVTLNASLREVVARAKKANMPQRNIDRLLERARGTTLQEVVYEAFTPLGVSLLITAITDNPNRTVADLRTLLKQHASSLGNPGSVRWKYLPAVRLVFDHTRMPNPDALALACIESDAYEVVGAATTTTVIAPHSNRDHLVATADSLGALLTESQVEHVVERSNKITVTPAQAKIVQQLITTLLTSPDIVQIDTDIA